MVEILATKLIPSEACEFAAESLEADIGDAINSKNPLNLKCLPYANVGDRSGLIATVLKELGDLELKITELEGPVFKFLFAYHGERLSKLKIKKRKILNAMAETRGPQIILGFLQIQFVIMVSLSLRKFSS